MRLLYFNCKVSAYLSCVVKLKNLKGNEQIMHDAVEIRLQVLSMISEAGKNNKIDTDELRRADA